MEATLSDSSQGRDLAGHCVEVCRALVSYRRILSRSQSRYSQPYMSGLRAFTVRPFFHCSRTSCLLCAILLYSLSCTLSSRI